MNKIFTALIIILLTAGCKKDKNNDTETIQYDYTVTKTHTSSETHDSTMYYYSNNNTLVAYADYIIDKRHEYNVGYEASQIKINCKSENIVFGNKLCYINDKFKIDSIHHQIISNSFVLYYNFKYDDDNKIISSERRNSVPELKHFYIYSNGMHIKDSIITIPYIDGHYKIIMYEYTDTINPGFPLNEYGLFEYPTKSNYLIRQTQTLDYSLGKADSSYNNYSYNIKDNELEINISNNGTHKTTTKYVLTHKK